MIVACYTMDLYCDNTNLACLGLKSNMLNGGQDAFTGETFSECKQQARTLGWVFKKDGKVYCPHCKKQIMELDQ